MKFKITITKEVIDKSLMCGKEPSDLVGFNCAFSVAYNEIIPNAWVATSQIRFKRDVGILSDTFCCHPLTKDQKEFVSKFDSYSRGDVNRRYTLVGQSFDVEIPDEVIEYWYGDASKAAQKIIDNPIMQVV